MAKASIVYWYSGKDMRSDGGGQRIRAWQSALESLGFHCEVYGLRTIGGGISKGARLSAAKRALLPMPFTRGLPSDSAKADVVIATVPAVFEDALRQVPHDRLHLDTPAVMDRNHCGINLFIEGFNRCDRSDYRNWKTP